MVSSSTRLSGTFSAVGDAVIEARRVAVLTRSAWYSEPERLHSSTHTTAEFLHGRNVRGAFVEGLRSHGTVEARLDRALTVDEFVAFGEWFGRLLPETAPDVRRYVEREAVLNIVAEHGVIDDVGLQPFSDTPLTLHTEGSGRTEEMQPRYLAFQCLAAAEPDQGSQTLVVSGERVHAALDTAERGILAHSRYQVDPPSPPILRPLEGRPCFSFRDFGDEPLSWVHEGEDGAVTPDDVRGALRSLTFAMYDPGSVRGIHWRTNTILVLDNTFGFHGRSAGLTSVSGPRRRHLQRLRILSG